MKNRFSHPRKRTNKKSSRTNRKGRKLGSVENLETRRLLTASGFATDLPQIENVDTAQIAQQHSHSFSGDRALRIVNGVQTSGFKAVGIVNNGCTGTLIAPNAVLTAAHCVEGNASGMSFDVGGKSYSVEKAVIHPEYETAKDIDLAVMILSENVTGVDPMEINRTAPKVGQVLTLVGFGATGTPQSGHNGDFGVKHVGQTPIDNVDATHIRWNYDNASESNTAPGDSGGPAFVTVNGQEVIAGVTSGGSQENAGLGDESFDVRVDAFANWIDNIVSGSTGNSSSSDDNNDGDDVADPVDEGNGDETGDEIVDEFDDEVSRSEAEQFALEELAEFDADGDGSLSRAELQAEMEAYGYSPDEAADEADFMLEDFDADQDGRLNLSELIVSWGGESSDLESDVDPEVEDEFDGGDEVVDMEDEFDEAGDEFDETDEFDGELDEFDGAEDMQDMDEGDFGDDEGFDDWSFDVGGWFDEEGSFDEGEPLSDDYDESCDVNLDGANSPIDALMVVNYLNSGNRVAANQLDVNGDGSVTPIDALRVINQINGTVARPANAAISMNVVENDGSGEKERGRVDLVFAAYANDSSL